MQELFSDPESEPNFRQSIDARSRQSKRGGGRWRGSMKNCEESATSTSKLTFCRSPVDLKSVPGFLHAAAENLGW